MAASVVWLAALLPFLAAIAASPSPSFPPPPTKRHSYAQYLAAGHLPHHQPPSRYGFEDPARADHYDERAPAGLAGSGSSVTWLEEMADRDKKPDEAPCA